MKYDFKKIEKKWQERWLKDKLYEPSFAKASAGKPDFDSAKRPFYNLMMFPYPSAEGLHVGNTYAFTGADIYGRKKRMEGYDVFQPIGLDGFGIHSENYALKIGTHPMDQSKISEKRFYEQLRMIGNGFAWDERLETYDPEYYKWTQWIFIQLFKCGLAYRKKQAVNWCPKDKTVLADEQVIAGKCERCGSVVEKKELEQWFFRITKYAEKLLANLDKIDWSAKVKIAQRNWIGKSEGAEIEFGIKDSDLKIGVFTTRPDTLFGATYMVLSPEHELLKNNELGIKNYEEVGKYVATAKKKSDEERIVEGKEKTGVELKGIKAINPANQEKIPIFVADYVLASYGTGAIMAVPAHDERDFEFAKKYNLEIKKVILPVLTTNPLGSAQAVPSDVAIQSECWLGNGQLINSGKFNGLDSEKAKWEITKYVHGTRKTQYRLRDWLISRQRYWGVPIPMIYCEQCGWQPVPEKDLPVLLPHIKDFRPQGKGESPLAAEKSFYETKCPKCGGKARRETDVSDTFLDSAWYYIGYLAKENFRFEILNSKFRDRARRWLPVNLYIGGAEHSVLHLLYVRFMAMVFHDMGLLDFEEPFPKFRAHGILISEGAKMSKSKGNVVNPDAYIKEFGADTLRMYLMFLAPFEQGGNFRDAGILGISRFLERVWQMATKYESNPNIRIFANDANDKNQHQSAEPALLSVNNLLHKTIKKVTEDIENLHYNTAISALMILLNELEKFNHCNITTLKQFLQLLAPFAPHITEEIWHNLGYENSIHKEKWPVFDDRFLIEENVSMIVQINGKFRSTLNLKRGLSQTEVEQCVSQDQRLNKLLTGQKILKKIFVPDRLINFVIKSS